MTAPAAPFGRVLTAMVTAFHDDGSLDLDGTVRVAAYLADHGHDGILVSGTTGESPTTSTREQGLLLHAVVEAVGDRLSVVAGVGTNDTAHSIELTEQATKLGAAGVLLVTPYYSKPSQPGVLHHFTEVARATDLPVMLYDVPGRTGTGIAMDTYRRAAELDNIVAVKEAAGDFARGSRLIDEAGLAIYSGDDVANLAWLAHGASGIVSVVGHLAGDAYADMVGAFLEGRAGDALAIYTRLIPAVDAVMGVANYGATTAKAALELSGVLTNRFVRPPLLPLDDDEVAALHDGLATAGLLPPRGTQ
ncbi:MAG: 4-hydroxy-tetrahydrodipicolinate synthase [Nocardioidaceae bacterium]